MGDLKKILDDHNININEFDVFVETGFYAGENFDRLYKNNYFNNLEKAYSIEIFKRFFDDGMRNFKYFGEDKYELIFGDSAIELKNIVEKHKNQKVLFWLDAHYSGKGTGVSELYGLCPALKELEAINNLEKKPLIIIDDLSSFYGLLSPGYPNKNQIIDLLNCKFKFDLIEDKNNDCFLAL